MSNIKFSPKHIAAVNRRRRVIVHIDASGIDGDWTLIDFIEAHKKESQIDSVWWDWCEGNEAVYPSKILPVVNAPKWKGWIEAGVNLPQIFLKETRKRNLEAFFSHRINGSDNDSGKPNLELPMKKAHPDWLIPAWQYALGYWNFAVQGVRKYKLSILQEIAENYDFDGIQIDFARVCPVLPPDHQWENREKLTDFMRSVRKMLLAVEKKRGRPYLLAAKVPENLEGAHFDGLDVETWAREQIVDIFILGVRSLDVDIPAFRRITAGTNIKLYPCHDLCHASDGYRDALAPIEVLRGVFANWLNQGADGIQMFNWIPSSEKYKEMDREMGSPDTLKYKDKVFVVQRRGGGHHMIALPEDWSTPRWMYFNTNMFAPLPAALENPGKKRVAINPLLRPIVEPEKEVDTLLTVAVGDDVNAAADRIERITLRVLLSDPAAKGLPEAERLERVLIEAGVRPLPGYQNISPAKGIKGMVKLRLNGTLLGPPSEERGWLVFETQPKHFTVGDNLVSLRLTQRKPDVTDQILIEKLEVHVKYR